LQSPYNFAFDNITNTYNFTTKNSILSRVAFVADYTFSTIAGIDIDHIYQIVIDKATDDIEPLDTRVSLTIEIIIERFFANIDNALVYVCSDEDEKAKLRFDVFDRWYKKSTFKNKIIKIDNEIKFSETQKLYTSFLFHKSNPNYKTLIEIYYNIEKVLNSGK
jgi:hypothetical protein